MYLPKHFAPTDDQAISWLVQRYPLAQIVRLDSSGHCVADPVPLLAKGEFAVGAQLVGHVARANPLWQQEGEVLCIFAGPQAYISPNAYPGKAEHHRVVPTYNYTTVQVRGHLLAIDDPAGKLFILRCLTDAAEHSQPTPWSVDDAPHDFVDAQLRAIVGIQIDIESIQAKFKLSQNRNTADKAGVHEYLAQQPSETEAATMLQLMRSGSKIQSK